MSLTQEKGAQRGAAVKAKKNVKVDQVRYPFWFGGSASCFAACCTHPLDLVKVRLQTASRRGPRRGMLGTFTHIVKFDGVLGLYSGLSASLLRQITYSTTRFGVYEHMKQRLTTPDRPPSFPTLIALSSTSGLLGGIVGNPADVLNVRMQNDAALPPDARRNYKHALDGLVRMVREEGVGSLFRGIWPNSARAVLMTSSQLASYDGFKRLLLLHTPLTDGMTTHFTASFLAGFVATTICSPVDVIKTRVMSAAERQGIVSLLVEIWKREGWAWMFRGWTPSFIRLGPQTVATMMFLEQHKRLYRKLKGVD